LVIGDVHGCSAALSALLAAIEPSSGDTVIQRSRKIWQSNNSGEIRTI